MDKVILGYTHVGDICPMCGNDYMSIHDDGDKKSYKVQCWCGATARVLKDDPDLLALIAAREAARG